MSEQDDREALASDEQHLSKRERQKRRKQAKTAARQVTVRRHRVRRAVTAGLTAVLAVAAAGALAWQWQGSRAERAALLDDVEHFEALDNVPHLGQHDYATIPPSELYDHRPSTGAPHTNNVIQTGVWERAIDERILGHNLEHGYVIAYWSPDADPDEIAALQETAQAAIDDGDQHRIATEHMNDEPIDDDAQFAFVSWSARVLLETFDEDVFEAFLAEYQQSADAPESHAGPHLGPDHGGGIDPASYDGDLLLPPLDNDPQLIREATG